MCLYVYVSARIRTRLISPIPGSHFYVSNLYYTQHSRCNGFCKSAKKHSDYWNQTAKRVVVYYFIANDIRGMLNLQSQCIWWVEWAKVCGHSKWESRVVWGIPGDTDVTSSQANWPKRIISKLRRVLVLLSRVFRILAWNSVSFKRRCLPSLFHLGLITVSIPVVCFIWMA